MMNILGHARLSLQDQAGDYAKAYQAGLAAARLIAVGNRFYGGHGYADHYSGSTPACRQSAAWKGALAGYLDGLPAAAKQQGVLVDEKGFILRIGREDMG